MIENGGGAGRFVRAWDRHLEDVLGDVEADHGGIGHVTSFELPAQS
jgi:hypothetical protein